MVITQAFFFSTYTYNTGLGISQAKSRAKRRTEYLPMLRYLPTTLSPVEQLYDTSFRVLIFKHSNVSKQKPFEKFGWLPTFTILPSW